MVIVDMDQVAADESDLRHGDPTLAISVRLRSLTVMADLAEAVGQAIAPLGMTAAASGLVSGPKAASDSAFHFTNWPADWLGNYIRQGFLIVDPTVRWARASGVPITFSDLIDRLHPRDPGKTVVADAASFGFTEGMAIPTRAGDGSLGLICFGGLRGKLCQAEQAFLIVVGREAFEAAERIERDGDIGRPSPILTAREVEAIRLATAGHSDRQIAKLLGLSERTARFHLGNAREKFGATSRTHLVALAVSRGYITL